MPAWLVQAIIKAVALYKRLFLFGAGSQTTGGRYACLLFS